VNAQTNPIFKYKKASECLSSQDYARSGISKESCDFLFQGHCVKTEEMIKLLDATVLEIINPLWQGSSERIQERALLTIYYNFFYLWLLIISLVASNLS